MVSFYYSLPHVGGLVTSLVGIEAGVEAGVETKGQERMLDRDGDGSYCTVVVTCHRSFVSR